MDVARALNGLRQETTLVVVVSKTFTTAETMLNARTVRCAHYYVSLFGACTTWEAALATHYLPHADRASRVRFDKGFVFLFNYALLLHYGVQQRSQDSAEARIGRTAWQHYSVTFKQGMCLMEDHASSDA